MNIFADFFLNFSRPTWMGCFFVIGLVVTSIQHRSSQSLMHWYRLAFLCALSLVVNVALKGTFKVPLAPFLGKVGYAFPSGHIQLATVFYGTLALFFKRKWFFGVTAILLIGIGFGLIHYHYHTLQDVIAGFLVGCFLVWGYGAICFVYPEKAEKCIWVMAFILMIYNLSVYKHVPKHAMIGFLVLTALTLLSMNYGKKR